MPTVLRVEGFRISILLPPREHGPAHVHVERGDGLVTVGLDPVTIITVIGTSRQDVRRAVRLVEGHRAELLTAGRTYHGEDA